MTILLPFIDSIYQIFWQLRCLKKDISIIQLFFCQTEISNSTPMLFLAVLVNPCDNELNHITINFHLTDPTFQLTVSYNRSIRIV